MRRKRLRRRREQKFYEQRPLVAQNDPTYVQQDDDRGVKELRYEYEPGNQVQGNVVELDSRASGPVEVGGGGDAGRNEPQEIQGYVAPASRTYDGRAVEMPAQAVRR